MDITISLIMPEAKMTINDLTEYLTHVLDEIHVMEEQDPTNQQNASLPNRFPNSASSNNHEHT